MTPNKGSILLLFTMLAAPWAMAQGPSEAAAPPGDAGLAATDDVASIRACLATAFHALTARDPVELAPLVYEALLRKEEWDFYDGEPGRLVVDHWREWWPKETPEADNARITVCGDLAYATVPAPLCVGPDLYYKDMDAATLAVVLARVGGAWKIAGMTNIMSSSDPEGLPPETRDQWVRGHEYLRADLSLAVRLMRSNPGGVLANTHSVVARAPVSGGLQVVSSEDFVLGRMETPPGTEGARFTLPVIAVPEDAEAFTLVGLTSALFVCRAEDLSAEGARRPLWWVMLLEWWPESARWKIPLVAVVSETGGARAPAANSEEPARGDGA